MKDVLSRFHEVLPRLESGNLTSYQKTIIRDAIGEIFGEKVPADGSPPFVLQSYNIEEISRLTDKDLPRFLFYRYRYDTFPKRRKLDNFPPCLQIEPTSICNYRCVFCFQKDKNFRDKKNGMMGMMPLGLFKKVIDQAEGNCEAVTLSSRGDPLICSDIEEMLKYVQGKFLALKMNTNASFLDETKAHSILQAGVNILVFSVDAATEPLYSQLRVGGQLDKVYKNIKQFQEIRTKHYPDSKIITRVSGVKTHESEDLDTMEKFWGELVDQVAFVNYNPWEGTYDLPVNAIVDPCSELWLRTFVWWDGVVNPCENDYKSMLAVGNANEEDLSKLWLSEKYMELRDRHQSKQRSQCFPCKGCVVI